MKQYTLTLDDVTVQAVVKGLAELPLKESLRPLQTIEAQIIAQQQPQQPSEEPKNGD